MIDLDALLHQIGGLERGEVVRWVENRWVLPERQGANWVFHEIDVARVELILHMRRDLAVDDEALALVLDLLDQVYSLRRQLRRLCDALEAQPAAIRDAVKGALPPGSAGGAAR